MLDKVEIEAKLQENDLPGVLLIESAKAVQNIYQIVMAAANCRRDFLVAFGAADYALSMGFELTRDGTELIHPRSCIAVACSAACIRPPIDTPFMIDLKDIEALQSDAFRAKQLGFQGKLCIHPNQIEPCHAIFSPSEEGSVLPGKLSKHLRPTKLRDLPLFRWTGNLSIIRLSSAAGMF
jgi:citrate lyase subunit beta/citryl-CoA lyase